GRRRGAGPALRRGRRPGAGAERAVHAAGRLDGPNGRPERIGFGRSAAGRPPGRDRRRGRPVLRLPAQRVRAGRPEAGAAAEHDRRLGGVGRRAVRADGRALRAAGPGPAIRGDQYDRLGDGIPARPVLAPRPGAGPEGPGHSRRRRNGQPGPVPDRHAVPAPPQVEPDRRGGGRRRRADRAPRRPSRRFARPPDEERVVKTHPLAAAIAAAVAGRDSVQLAAAVTDTVRLRALLPGGPIEEHGRDAVVARFGRWFADLDAVDLVESAGEAIADRVLIHYRLDLAQRGTRWACTQTSICKVNDGRLATIDLLCSGFREIVGGSEMRNPALDAWGDYDLDDPYPLFAQVQADGPVHEVTLADGHRAWLIVRHEEAKAALNHAGLSKDMHAALARDGAVVAEGL